MLLMVGLMSMGVVGFGLKTLVDRGGGTLLGGGAMSSKYFYNIWSETLVGVLKVNSWPLQNVLGGPPKCGLYI